MACKPVHALKHNYCSDLSEPPIKKQATHVYTDSAVEQCTNEAINTKVGSQTYTAVAAVGVATSTTTASPLTQQYKLLVEFGSTVQLPVLILPLTLIPQPLEKPGRTVQRLPPQPPLLLPKPLQEPCKTFQQHFMIASWFSDRYELQISSKSLIAKVIFTPKSEEVGVGKMPCYIPHIDPNMVEKCGYVLPQCLTNGTSREWWLYGSGITKKSRRFIIINKDINQNLDNMNFSTRSIPSICKEKTVRGMTVVQSMKIEHSAVIAPSMAQYSHPITTELESNSTIESSRSREEEKVKEKLLYKSKKSYTCNYIADDESGDEFD